VKAAFFISINEYKGRGVFHTNYLCYTCSGMGTESTILSLIAVVSFICSFGLVPLWSRNRHAVPLSLLIFVSGLWSLFVALFFETQSRFSAGVFVSMYYAAAALSMVFGVWFTLSYLVRGTRLNRIRTYVGIVILTITVITFCMWPGLLYSEIDMYNRVVELNRLPYTIYVIYLFFSFALVVFLFYKTTLKKNIRLVVRAGLKRVLVLWVVAGTTATVFNLWLPFFGNYSLIWIGPVMIVFQIPMALILATTTEYFGLAKIFLKGLISFLSVVLSVVGYLVTLKKLYSILPPFNEVDIDQYYLYGMALLIGMGFSWGIFKLHSFLLQLVDSEGYNEAEVLRSVSQIASEKHGVVEFFRAVRHTLDKAFEVEFVDVIVFGQETSVHVKGDGLEELMCRLSSERNKYGTI